LTFVGRLEEVKRVDRIIDAVGRLNGRLDQGLELRIVGDGSRRDSLEQRAVDIAPRAVEFVGAVDRDRVPAELWVTDVFVMASRMENHPIALKEALACGTYCVAPSKGRIPELLDDEKQGIVYGSGVDALTDALEQTITERRYADIDPAERAKTFDGWDENAAAIVDLYRKLAGEQQGDPSGRSACTRVRATVDASRDLSQ
jgi:glycosyltransferase involved in cell wall biosynthesis